MAEFTFIYPYYNNPEMLARHLDNWEQYPQNMRDCLSCIIIDDGSAPKNAATKIIGDRRPFKDFRVYRVTKNIPWNQHGARNLGALEAKDGWLLMTDMDNMFEWEEALKIFVTPFDPANYWTFERVQMPERTPYRYHCNTFLIQKEAFWAVGGYDEDFCGTYGGDGHLHRAMTKQYPRMHCNNISHLYFPRGHYKDAGTMEWEKTRKQDRSGYFRVRDFKKGPYEPKNHIRFPWVREI